MRPSIALQILSSHVMFIAFSTAAAWGDPCGDTSGPEAATFRARAAIP
jgi:hypothetical protein